MTVNFSQIRVASCPDCEMSEIERSPNSKSASNQEQTQAILLS
ncbi:hypothetical protein COO91_03077 [Nostoc flagelliforme CCNUN1]|uniref:Uncharacterized protein n=1 Tax=Nostoc flagelliforme CCNUN1 TaxID=2038116 RepID=A0A2K8SNZ4_9NOSO|nr:hypothetical protein COO91_03077 [Nostoc flagelliforme CCNUN1]